MAALEAEPISNHKDQINAFEHQFRQLLDSEFSEAPITREEQRQLERIEQKIEELKAMTADSSAAGAVGNIQGEASSPTEGSRQGRAKMGNQLKQMRSTLDGLLKDIQNIDVG